MKYFLSIHAIGNHPTLKIDETKFIELQDAKKALDAALAIEQRYDILIENYLDFEKELLSILVEQTVKNFQGYSDTFILQTSINRRIINLLTSTKSYIDQAKHHIEDCSLSKEELDDWRENERSTCFEFRFMEAMRNYAQHRGLPVHCSSIGMGSVDEGESSAIEHRLQLFAQKSKLDDDKRFNPEVLKEMAEVEKVELTSAIRVYISSINRIHIKIREAISDRVSSSRGLVGRYIEKYLEINESSTGLYAYKVNSRYSSDPLAENILEKVLLILKWDDIRIELVKRNGKISHLEKGYVTGKVTKS